MLVRMEDIVAVEVGLDTGESRFFLTWGRIQHPVEREKLAAVVLRNAPRFAIGEGAPVSARVRWSLQPAIEAPYFFESFFEIASGRFPTEPGTKRGESACCDECARARRSGTSATTRSTSRSTGGMLASTLATRQSGAASAIEQWVEPSGATHRTRSRARVRPDGTSLRRSSGHAWPA